MPADRASAGGAGRGAGDTPQAAAEAVVKRIVAQEVPTVGAADAALLLAAPNRTLLMEKLLAVHFHLAGDIPAALAHAETVFAAEETSENAKNIALLHRKAKRTGDGIAFVEAYGDLMAPIERNDILCMLHHDAGDRAGAARHGTESLRLKDASAPDAPPLTPVLNAYDPEKPGRNLIVFSLWGSDARYLTGAVNNAIVARYLYPGWQCRFYVDGSVPPPAIKSLLQQRAQVRMAPKDLPAGQYGLFWRFLVEDDPEVDLYLVRDADSVMNIKERAAVEDWLASDRAFHVMRDLPTHSELILAGMWGAHRGNLGTMRARIETHVAAEMKKVNNKITDQVFLRTAIWPIVRQSVLVHDAHFDFGEVRRYREEFRLPVRYHIGQNDWVHRRPATPPGKASGG